MDFSVNERSSKKPLMVGGILVVVVCVFVGIAFSFKVFPWQGGGVPSVTPTSTARITTSSGVEGYTLHIADQNALKQLMSDYGFWDSYQWDQYGTRASHLYIVFTDKIQPLDRLMAQDQSVLSSYGVTFDTGKVFVFIQIDPTIDHFDTRANNIVTQYLGRFLYSIYPPGKKAMLSEEDFLKSFYTGPDLFSLIKT